MLPNPGLTVFHGTDLDSGLRFLNGMALDAAAAAARKMDGPPGFFLAFDVNEAAFFAVRRMPGTVVQVTLSPVAVRQLQAAGMIRQRPGLAIHGRGADRFARSLRYLQ